ncbi:MAG TPA: DbpA RNA binding domain-containing protein, partial [Pseudothauera hydrothermalis]|nr:DbpA RNA binding domain-containing protein [Pseudothauera hydrothermalis]
IVGAIANEGGIEGRYIGQIHLFDDYSTVELPKALPPELLDLLKRIRVRQRALAIRALADGQTAQDRSRARTSRSQSASRQADEAGTAAQPRPRTGTAHKRPRKS